MLHTKRWLVRFLFAFLVAALLSPVYPAGAAGLPTIPWGEKTLLVFMATDDPVAIAARMPSSEKMVMLILIGKDFEMTEEAAEGIRSEIRLHGEEGEYEAAAVFVAEADEGNNPDVEVYFQVPDEPLTALTMRFLGGEGEVSLSDAPKSINDSITALIEELSPADLTIQSLDEDDAMTLDLRSAPQAKPLIDMIQSENTESYQAALDFLNEGNVFKKGLKGEAAKGLQLLLFELKEDVKADGKIGAKTIAAAQNAVRGSLIGPDDELEEIDKAAFESMLVSLLMIKDEAGAISYLTTAAEEPEKEITYYKAANAFRDGAYYTAYQEYAGLPGYRLSDAYAELCPKPFPESGEIARNEAFAAKKCRLSIHATLDEGVASCVKVRTVEGEDVTMIFIKESGEIGVRLPEGEYTVSVGVGETWYGEKEAFGGAPGAYYLTLNAEEGNPVFSFESGYSYTLTLKGDMEEGDLTSENLDYGAFTGKK